MSCTLVNETCPAAVSTVNLITNVFNLGTGDAQYTHEPVPLVDIVAREFTLAAIPAANTFRLFKNGQVLVETSDYARVDDKITLVVAPSGDDVFVVDYLPTPA